MSIAIETRNLSKNYGDVRAVSDLSLRVNAGEIYAFLGLNGAGKTTTIRMLLGMIKPSQGDATVLGKQINARGEKPWDVVGYLVETTHAYPDLSVRENLEAVRRLRPGIPSMAVDEMIEHLSLSTYAERKTGTLSLGNAQRLGLAKALLHRPRLLILDEPANGLDPAGIVEIRNLLIDLASNQGVTIFLSSHILGEVSRLADRIGIIHEGRLIQELSKDELHQNRKRQLLIRTRDCAEGQRILSALGYGAKLNTENEIVLEDDSAFDKPDTLSTLLVEQNQAPMMLRVEEEDLEDYFMRLVGMETAR